VGVVGNEIKSHCNKASLFVVFSRLEVTIEANGANHIVLFLHLGYGVLLGWCFSSHQVLNSKINSHHKFPRWVVALPAKPTESDVDNAKRVRAGIA
jgi:hypothetical protein